MEQFVAWAQRTPQIRANILSAIHQARSGHPGGSLSLVEILYALLGPGGIMRHGPQQANTPHRDRLVLSKGHGVPALYAVLADRGYLEPAELTTLRQLGSRLQGHPDRVRLPIVEASTGSLGQGASIALGMAQGYGLEQNPHRIYCIIGDGEMQEGQIWEAALSAPHHQLGNLTLIVDYNQGQIDGPTNQILNLEPVDAKWQAFGWHVHQVDGHNYQQLTKALGDVHPQRPSFIIAHTVKGKGVDFMEHPTAWHGKATTDQELQEALKQVKSNPSIGLG